MLQFQKTKFSSFIFKLNKNYFCSLNLNNKNNNLNIAQQNFLILKKKSKDVKNNLNNLK